MSKREITVCYAVTPDGEWAARAAASAYSAARANPGVRIRIAEIPGGDYPWGLWPAVLPGPDVDADWVLMLDADTWVSGDLQRLFDVGDADIYLRTSSAWTGRKINRDAWRRILDHFGLPHVPVWSNGCMLMPWSVSAILRELLPRWTEAISACGLPDPLMRFRDKPEWWMRDQFALAAIIADHRWHLGELTAREWSWNWKQEPMGIVHHLGSDADPFGEELWRKLRKS